MGEYQEDDADFNDLLESDSDDEDRKDEKKTVENLLSLDDVVISDSTGDYKSKNLDFMFLPETFDDDDDEDDNSMTGRHEAKMEEDLKLELEKRRNFQKLLHSVPPGIDLFRLVNSIYLLIISLLCLQTKR